MAAITYRPILDVPVKPSVPRALIRKAVEELAELEKNDPEKYEEELRANGTGEVTLVLSETPTPSYGTSSARETNSAKGTTKYGSTKYGVKKKRSASTASK